MRRARAVSVGMTLIEIMIVVALIAILTATLVFGSGIFTGANRRAAATLVVAGVRKGLAHANATGKPVRLALDLDSARVVLEEASSREVLRSDESQDDDGDGAHADSEDNRGAELLAEAEAMAGQILSGAVTQKPSFTPLDVLGEDGDKPGRALGQGVQFVQVQTEHDEDPVTRGAAHIYFWPGGVTERAVVQIRGRNQDSGISVVISALTGRAQIKRGLLDLPEGISNADGEYSERDEP